MHTHPSLRRRAALSAAALLAAVILVCAVLILAGAAGLATAVLLLLLLLALAGNFLFDFALNPHSRFNMATLFERGRVKGAEDRTALQVGEDAQNWRAWRAESVQWLDQQRQEISVASGDGTILRGYRLLQDGHLYAILCHGYASGPAHLAGTARKFYDMGFSIITPFARGHGSSGGSCLGMGWLDRMDVLAWTGSIIAHDPEAEILLFGVSMGGATVMMAAGEALPHNVKCIVEDCGYSSVWDEFSYQLRRMFHLPAFPLLHMADLICQLRAGYRFKEASAVDQLQRAAVPMLFIHGEEDVFVPYSMLDVVYGACASAGKEKLSIPGGAHAQCVSTDPVRYWDGVTAFLKKNFSVLAE